MASTNIFVPQKFKALSNGNMFWAIDGNKNVPHPAEIRSSPMLDEYNEWVVQVRWMNSGSVQEITCARCIEPLYQQKEEGTRSHRANAGKIVR